MKKAYLTFQIFLFVMFPLYAIKAEPSFKNAQIRYQLVGKQKGAEDLYIKEKKMRSITTMKTPEGESIIVIDILSISDSDYLTILDLNQKVGVRLNNPFRKSFNKMTSEDIEEFHRKMLLGIDNYNELKEIGNEKILGKECRIFEIDSEKFQNKLWIWNDLILKSEMTGTVAFEKIATDVKIDENISDSLFNIPQEIEIVDRTET